MRVKVDKLGHAPSLLLLLLLRSFPSQARSLRCKSTLMAHLIYSSVRQSQSSISSAYMYRSTNTRGPKLPTHKNLKDRIAAFQRLDQQNNPLSTSPSLSPTSSSPGLFLTAANSNSNVNNDSKYSLRDEIARFEAAGETSIPRGSSGVGGEMLGNRDQKAAN